MLCLRLATCRHTPQYAASFSPIQAQSSNWKLRSNGNARTATVPHVKDGGTTCSMGRQPRQNRFTGRLTCKSSIISLLLLHQNQLRRCRSLSHPEEPLLSKFVPIMEAFSSRTEGSKGFGCIADLPLLVSLPTRWSMLYLQILLADIIIDLFAGIMQDCGYVHRLCAHEAHYPERSIHSSSIRSRRLISFVSRRLCISEDLIIPFDAL